MSLAPRSLPALTGLRFLAASHVVVFHYLDREGMPGWLVQTLMSGPNSVTLFFVLSGFILAYSYLGAEPNARVPARAFWAARFARVYPVYLVGLLLAAPVFVSKGLQERGLSGASLLELGGVGAAVAGLVQAWVPAAACQWNCPGWSLSVEAFFYLVFPFAALPVLRLGPRRLVMALGLSVLAGAALVVAWLAVERTVAAPGGLLSHDAWMVVGAYNPLLRLPHFLLGVFLGRLYCLRRQRVSASPPWDAALVAVGGLASLGLMAHGWEPTALAFKDVALLPGFACVLWGLAGGTEPLGRALSHRICVRLGEASYALYLLHAPLNNWLRAVDQTLRLGWWSRGPGFFTAYALLSVAVSLAVFRYVEEPARRGLRQRLTTRQQSAPDPRLAP
ncbi:acyltransferase [Corallococcus sp. M34]|uniref:acyltransferase family protein n=1 Tax=Citreicoccus inhibens TaxID=2849499 RepID=UPI001C23E093|nr:acyltransferase [Citreicoccus inhibens]MBU8894845.1 acyltransferase [Citreicoccus inhibens]